jgi:hypothetical protein
MTCSILGSCSIFGNLFWAYALFWAIYFGQPILGMCSILGNLFWEIYFGKSILGNLFWEIYFEWTTATLKDQLRILEPIHFAQRQCATQNGKDVFKQREDENECCC